MKRVALALLLAASTAGAEQPMFLHEVRVVSTAAHDAEWSQVLVEVELHPDAAKRTGAVTTRGGAKAQGNTLRLVSEKYPGGKDKPGPQHRASTFVIDWKDPAVLALKPELGESVTPERLRAFVDQYIDKKGMGRAYDFASVVAKGRAGDCTEHAVLLAALARMSSLPSRVVHGLVLVKLPDGPRAFGHAWIEVAQNGTWRVLDAALSEKSDPLYIPLAVMQDEGPAYSMKLWTQTTPADVVGVRIAPRP